MSLLVRTEVDPNGLAQAVREEVRRIDPAQALSEVVTLRSEVDDAIAPIRIIATVLLVFAAVTLTLAAIGVYGVVANTVGRQTREVGVRMALGARPSQVLAAVLTDTLRVCGWSAMPGLLISAGIHVLIGAKLYNLASVSPARLAGLSVFLILISLFAAFVPARRAASVDPAIALRAL
jgi:ABC-type antimicrobial peptide transport system permease subunit